MNAEIYATVRVFLNEARSADGHWLSIHGYQPGEEALTKEFSFRWPDTGSNERLCDVAYDAFNRDLDMFSPGPMLELARAYRAGRRRSLSVGDVIVIERAGAAPKAYAVADIGYKPIEMPAALR